MLRNISWAVRALLLAGGLSGCTAWHHVGETPADRLHVAERVPLGSTLSVPVGVEGGRAVALQFDLAFDPELVELTGGTTGPAAQRASKELTVRPVARGVARVVVYGANLDPLPSGSLGAVTFRVLRPASRVEFRAVERAAPDAAGRELPTAVRPGSIAIRGGG